MADLIKFRGAVGGFNRADVVRYIESLCEEHQKQLRALQSELQAQQEQAERLRAENAALTDESAAVKAALETLRTQDEALSEQIESLSSQAAELAAQAAQEKERADALNTQLAAFTQEKDADAQEPVPEVEPAPDYPSLELEAYRRAEQTERNASERAGKIYRRLYELCERAQERYADASGEVAALTSDLAVNLERLQQTLADLQLVSDDTQDAFDALDLPALEQ